MRRTSRCAEHSRIRETKCWEIRGGRDKSMDSLKNQVAVVTGSSSGIGKAIALALAGHGAELFLAARGKEALSEAAKEAEEHTSELQSLAYLVCRLLLEKKKAACTPIMSIAVLNVVIC